MAKLSVVPVLCLAVLLCGCASNKTKDLPVKDPGFYSERIPRDDFMDVYDPWEGFNRRSYAFNRQFDRFVFLPVVRAYRFVTPKILRTGVMNFWNNLAEVEITAASLLQFRFKKAARSTGRFAINSVLGVGGLNDVATDMGVAKVREDFGQTFGRWGIPAGPYLVLPILGPSSARDSVGLVADWVTNLAVNIAGMPRARRDHLWLGGLYAVAKRDSVPFRYGQLKSPFEYEMVRYAITEARVILVEE